MNRTQQYVIAPPSVPEFLYGHYESVWDELIEWAEKEYTARRHYLGKHGYYKEYVIHNEEWSPIRILAEMSGFRRLCAKLTSELWKRFNKIKKGFIINAYDMRDLLLR